MPQSWQSLVLNFVIATACNEGDLGSIPGSGISSGEGNSNPLQCSCLENPTDGGTWQATVHRIAKTRTWLKWLSTEKHSQRTASLESGFNLSLATMTCSGKQSTFQCRRCRRHGFDPWVGKISWSRIWQPSQYSCLKKASHGQRILAGYSWLGRRVEHNWACSWQRRSLWVNFTQAPLSSVFD